MSPILEGLAGSGSNLSTKIVVSNPNLPVTARQNRVIIDISLPGPKGDKGDQGVPGDLDRVSDQTVTGVKDFQEPFRVGRFTTAGLLAKSALQGAVATVTDSIRGLWMRGASRWFRLSPFVNVQEFGAVADGATDDTAAIQAAIDAVTAAAYSGAWLHFPAGRYRVTSTLLFPRGTSGGRVTGAGALLSNVHTGNLEGPQSILMWDGVAGGTIIEQPNPLAWSFEHITLTGRRTAAGPTRAGIGFLCSSIAGFGAGVGSFHHVSFYDLDVAAQMAVLSTDPGCADYGFYDCQWQSVDVCFKVLGLQGLNYRFQAPSVVNCRKFLDLQRGGAVYINAMNSAGCGGTATDDWIIDCLSLQDNSAFVAITGWRAEQNCKQFIRAKNQGKVIVEAFEEAQGSQGITQFNMAGTTLVLRNSRIISKGAATPSFTLAKGAGGESGGLIVEGTHFDSTTWIPDEWIAIPNANHDVPVQLKNCLYGNAPIPIPGINNNLYFGPVDHTATTTSAAAVASGFLGKNGIKGICRIPSDTLWLIEASIVGREVGGALNVFAGQRRALVQNVAGTMSIVGSVQTLGTDTNAAGWTVTLIVSSGNGGVWASLAGATSTTIHWAVKLRGVQIDAFRN